MIDVAERQVTAALDEVELVGMVAVARCEQQVDDRDNPNAPAGSD